MRCCTTRDRSSFDVNFFISSPLMFLDSIFDLLVLVIPDVINNVLGTAKKSFWLSFSIYCVPLGYSVNSLPRLPVPFEEHDLQDFEKMGLVRARTLFHSHYIFITAVRDGHKCCSIFILNEVGVMTCGARCSGNGARRTTYVRVIHLRRYLLTLNMMRKLVAPQSWTSRHPHSSVQSLWCANLR